MKLESSEKKNNPKIPKQFQLFGHIYKVEMIDDLYEKEDCHGTADPENKLIKLQKAGIATVKSKDKNKKEIEIQVKITESDVEETFYHELTHIILSSMEETKLYSDEKFVSLFSRSLHQIFNSSIYI